MLTVARVPAAVRTMLTAAVVMRAAVRALLTAATLALAVSGTLTAIEWMQKTVHLQIWCLWRQGRSEGR